MSEQTKTCTKCGALKPVREFPLQFNAALQRELAKQQG